MARALTLKTEFSTKDFSKLIRTCNDPRVRQRLIGLKHVLHGNTASTAGELIGITPAAMANWVHRFNIEGIEGIYDRPRSGRRCQLSEEQKQSFKQRIEAGPTEQDEVVRFRWQEFQRILANEYGAIYTSPYGVLKLVHSLGISWITPRQIHPKSSEEKKNEFKKNTT